MNSLTKWYIQQRQNQHNKETKQIYQEFLQGNAVVPGQTKVQHSKTLLDQLDEPIFKWEATLKTMSKTKKFGVSLLLCVAMYLPYEYSQYQTHQTHLLDLVQKHYWLHYTEEGKSKLQRINQALQLK